MRDQLDNDALAARRAGMRYGDYMAVKQRIQKGEAGLAGPRRLCQICGAPLTRKKQEKYCSEECRQVARDRRKRERRER